MSAPLNKQATISLTSPTKEKDLAQTQLDEILKAGAAGKPTPSPVSLPAPMPPAQVAVPKPSAPPAPAKEPKVIELSDEELLGSTQPQKPAGKVEELDDDALLTEAKEQFIRSQVDAGEPLRPKYREAYERSQILGLEIANEKDPTVKAQKEEELRQRQADMDAYAEAFRRKEVKEQAEWDNKSFAEKAKWWGSVGWEAPGAVLGFAKSVYGGAKAIGENLESIARGVAGDSVVDIAKGAANVGMNALPGSGALRQIREAVDPSVAQDDPWKATQELLAGVDSTVIQYGHVPIQANRQLDRWFSDLSEEDIRKMADQQLQEAREVADNSIGKSGYLQNLIQDRKVLDPERVENIGTVADPGMLGEAAVGIALGRGVAKSAAKKFAAGAAIPTAYSGRGLGARALQTVGKVASKYGDSNASKWIGIVTTAGGILSLSPTTTAAGIKMLAIRRASKAGGEAITRAGERIAAGAPLNRAERGVIGFARGAQGGAAAGALPMAPAIAEAESPEEAASMIAPGVAIGGIAGALEAAGPATPKFDYVPGGPKVFYDLASDGWSKAPSVAPNNYVRAFDSILGQNINVLKADIPKLDPKRFRPVGDEKGMTPATELDFVNADQALRRIEVMDTKADAVAKKIAKEAGITTQEAKGRFLSQEPDNKQATLERFGLLPDELKPKPIEQTETPLSVGPERNTLPVTPTEETINPNIKKPVTPVIDEAEIARAEAAKTQEPVAPEATEAPSVVEQVKRPTNVIDLEAARRETETSPETIFTPETPATTQGTFPFMDEVSKLPEPAKLKAKRGKKGEQGSVIIPTWDEIRQAGATLYDGAKDFATWSKEMVSKFGDTIKDALKEIWDGIKGAYDRFINDETGAAGDINPIEKKLEGTTPGAPPEVVTTDAEATVSKKEKGKGVPPTPLQEAKKLVTPEQRKLIIEAEKRIKEVAKNNPEAVKLEIQYDSKTGLPKFEKAEDGTETISYKKKRYEFEKAPGLPKSREARVRILKDKLVAEGKAALADDTNAGGVGWYQRMRGWLQKTFGANIEMFAQLLGAASARTPVAENFKQALEAGREYSRGKYNELLQRYHEHVMSVKEKFDSGRALDEWLEANPGKKASTFDKLAEYRKEISSFKEVPLRGNGKKFNANSAKVLQALYGNWLQVTKGPKTPNFAGNLTGRTLQATIDVWAARTVRRLLYSDRAKNWRLLPEQETGVDYTLNKNGEYGGDFFFAQEAFEQAANELGMNPDDLQGLLWYHEKGIWDKNGWTAGEGAEKASFDSEASKMDAERIQAGITTFKDAETFNKEAFDNARKSLKEATGKLDGIDIARVTESDGLYGGVVEPTFDLEATVAKGTDLQPLANEVIRVAQESNQMDTFLSKVVDVDHPNARPMVEIGFKNPATPDQLKAVTDAFTSRGIDGFTVAKDERGNILGIRAQFVPEISARWDSDMRTKLAEGKYSELAGEWFDKMIDALPDIEGQENISYAQEGYVSTDVWGMEDYANPNPVDLDGGIQDHLTRRIESLSRIEQNSGSVVE